MPFPRTVLVFPCRIISSAPRCLGVSKSPKTEGIAPITDLLKCAQDKVFSHAQHQGAMPFFPICKSRQIVSRPTSCQLSWLRFKDGILATKIKHIALVHCFFILGRMDVNFPSLRRRRSNPSSMRRSNIRIWYRRDRIQIGSWLNGRCSHIKTQ